MLSVEGKVDVRCRIEDAWDLFCRFGDVAALIPTVEQVEFEGEQVHARVEIKLGALPISSRIILEVLEQEPYLLRARGVSYLGETLTEQMKKNIDGIGAGSVGLLNLRLELAPGDKEGDVTISYRGEVDAKGRLKRIYKAILKTKVPTMMEEFAENIREALESLPETEAAPSSQVVESQPTRQPRVQPAAPQPQAARSAESQRRGIPDPMELLERLFSWLRELFTLLREALAL